SNGSSERRSKRLKWKFARFSRPRILAPISRLSCASRKPAFALRSRQRRSDNVRFANQAFSRHHFLVIGPGTFADCSGERNGIEIGNQAALAEHTNVKPSKLVVASYNIRYAVGRYLISSGLVRKGGLNFPLKRAEATGRNIKAAARAFSDDV